MSESLYSLTEQFNAVLDGALVFDEDTGEILWTKENLDQLQMAVAEKFRRCTLYAKSQKAQAESYKEYAKQLTNAAKIYEKKAEAIESYMLACLQECGGEVKGDGITARIRKCPVSVQILDEAEIPNDYRIQKFTESFDKKQIKADLLGGYEVPGATLVQNLKVEVK